MAAARPGDTVRWPTCAVSAKAGTWRSIMRLSRPSTAAAFSPVPCCPDGALGAPERVIMRVSSPTRPE
jgi:hypothetical protein